MYLEDIGERGTCSPSQGGGGVQPYFCLHFPNNMSCIIIIKIELSITNGGFVISIVGFFLSLFFLHLASYFVSELTFQ